ncbi:GTPase-activating protein gyp8 [Tieghemiomyces parasiticus]|uniref:GTPase-activating protein gyp8 n=1 Tax=Tieghemiomyces parasiticus TaxID=78921 RepID=A0A9W8DRT4_9FUNG|nr:GTPase-activating protein gyp8 [Tieghemiomyces parasiticus]
MGPQQDSLRHILTSLFRRNSWLRYYQGLNDICTVFLLTLGPQTALAASEHACLLFFRDFMSHDFSNVHIFLGCIYTLVQHVDDVLYERIVETAGLPPYFATSWLLTWFSHDLPDIKLAARLFDFLLTQNPLMPVYLVAALILAHRDPLLAFEPEFSVLHEYLSGVPGRLRLADVNRLIIQAQELWRKFPPSRLFRGGFHPQSCVTTYPSVERFLVTTDHWTPSPPTKGNDPVDTGMEKVDEGSQEFHDLNADLVLFTPAEPDDVESTTAYSETNEIVARREKKLDPINATTALSEKVGSSSSVAPTHPLDLTSNLPALPLATTWPTAERHRHHATTVGMLHLAPAIQAIWNQTKERLQHYALHPPYQPSYVSRQALVAVTVYAAAALLLYLQSHPAL